MKYGTESVVKISESFLKMFDDAFFFDFKKMKILFT